MNSNLKRPGQYSSVTVVKLWVDLIIDDTDIQHLSDGLRKKYIY